jgi:hypothetical protein
MAPLHFEEAAKAEKEERVKAITKANFISMEVLQV